MSKKNAFNSVVFGFAVLGMVIIITWRWLLQWP